METLLKHFSDTLKELIVNTGTPEEPVLIPMLKTVEEDEGQLDQGAATLQMPAAYIDITEMAYSQAGENLGTADTEVTLRLAVKKDDKTKYSIIKAITKALVGTSGERFGGILKESQKKVDSKDLFEYRLTFGCMLYDDSAAPVYIKLENDEKPEGNLTFKIRK